MNIDIKKEPVDCSAKQEISVDGSWVKNEAGISDRLDFTTCQEKHQTSIAIKIETSDITIENDMDNINPQLESILTDELILKNEAVTSNSSKISEVDSFVKNEQDIWNHLDFTEKQQGNITIKTEISAIEMESDLGNSQMELLLPDELIIKDEGVICNANDISNKRIECKICKKTLCKRYFKEHMLVHSDDKKFHCEICGYKTVWKSNLRTHLKMHTAGKVCECKLCDYKTAIKGSLKQHMLTHAKEKPYECNNCDYKTAIKGNLKLHMMIHTEEKHYEKAYECKHCHYKTAIKSRLKWHMVTHAKKKLYECKNCVYKTAFKGNWQIHMLTHTKEF